MTSDIAFAGTIPENYDRFLGPLLFEPYAMDLADRIRGKKYKEVLELACGTGRVTRHLRQVLPAGAKLVATDLNADMIKEAAALMPDESINWQTADALELFFADESFDLVICQFGLMFMPDKLRALTEARRVLKPGGKFIFNTWDKIENNGAIYLGNQIICSYFPENPPRFYKLPFSFYNPDEMETLLITAGFSNIKISLVKKEGYCPSAAEAAIGIVERNPVYGYIVERDPELVPVIRKAVEKKISQTHGNSPL